MIQLIISGEVSEEYVFFTDLYQRYQRLMYSVAKRYAASENEAEDIMQDAVERLLKRIPKLMELPGCTLPTYLVYTVRSTAVNFKRHQNVIEKHTLPIDYDDGNTYEEPSESPQEILEREEQQRQFAAIWDQIPRADAELLYRKYILQESDEKLAEIYHCKKESIRMKLTRAKRKVISLMKGCLLYTSFQVCSSVRAEV